MDTFESWVEGWWRDPARFSTRECDARSEFDHVESRFLDQLYTSFVAHL